MPGMVLDGLAGRLGYQAVVADRAKLDVADEGGGGFSIVYRPRQAMSPAILDLSTRLQDMQVELERPDAVYWLADVAAELAQALEDLVVEWDLMEPDPASPDPESPRLIPVAHTFARLRRVDLLTLSALFGAIIADSKGHMSKPAGTPSPEPINGGSSQKARPVTSRAGASRRK